MLQAAFDKYAGAYDGSFSRTRVGRLQRKAVHQILRDTLIPGSRVLEINAGTGEDAIWLASQGHTVLATDLSPAMVRRIQEKSSGMAGITAKVMDFTMIGSEPRDSADVIFSDFGGLNCASPQEWDAFLSGANSVLRTGGMLLLVIMGRKCIWEKLYFTIKPNRGDRNRRISRTGVQTIINGEQFLTWYYSPEDIVRMSSNGFTYLLKRPVGLFVPPSFLEPLVTRVPGLLPLLAWLERMSAGWSFASDYADHYLICLRKGIQP